MNDMWDPMVLMKYGLLIELTVLLMSEGAVKYHISMVTIQVPKSRTHE